MVKIHFNYCQWPLKLAFRYELKENEIDDKRARWVNEMGNRKGNKRNRSEWRETNEDEKYLHPL